MKSMAPNIASRSPVPVRAGRYASELNLMVTVSAKKRALARRTGSLGSNSAYGAISATNSRRTADSANFCEAGEGASGATSGPP